MNNPMTTKLNWRAMVLFFMLFSFGTLPFSGLMLHEAIGHHANGLQYLSMALHNVAAIVFLVATIIHMTYHWKPIVNYLRNKKDQLLRYPKEMLVSVSTLLALLLAAVAHVVHSHL